MEMSVQMSILILLYLVASVLFVIGLRMLSHPETARKGNLLAAFGMGAAILGTMFLHENTSSEGAIEPIGNHLWIFGAIVIGGIMGWLAAKKVQMTAMPQMVSLFNGMGGACAAVISMIEFGHHQVSGEPISMGMYFCILSGLIIGTVSFSGSMIAYAKLQGIMEKSPRLPMQNVINLVFMVAPVALAVMMAYTGSLNSGMLYSIFAISFIYGILFVVPIGGADMPVVISLLNSFTGVAAASGGFLYNNQVMLTGGILVGAAGTLLTILMCKAMNRSLTNVLFSAFGGGGAGAASAEGLSVKETSVTDAAVMMKYANSVVIVPGYGLAVAQGQHVIQKMAQELEANGVQVSYAIHPVAGRMPGHMNVLLAEANIPYEVLKDMEEINPDFPTTDVVLVIGANDVVNPAARTDTSSPIYGMPILDADKAKTVIVMKRSMGKGYAGIENQLFYEKNCFMLFGDAKKSIEHIVEALKSV